MQNNGEEYEPSTIKSFISYEDRHLKGNGYPVPIKEGTEFAKTRSVLQMKQKQLKGLGKGNKPNAAEALQQHHIDKILETNSLDDSNTKSLIRSLCLVYTINFGMRTGQEAYNLRCGISSAEMMKY